ncbi:RNase P subunit p30 family protein [Halopenitus salinus]|uniref:Ribonuclease P protein component 3 n=1 Tax=Halopenitus salinus TaxID=1198295 RepID=A0ABD5UZ79_9EURY
MYEAVHAYPDGDSTVARFAETAARMGYDGIVVRTRAATSDPGSNVSSDLEALREEYGIDVVAGVEVQSDDRSSASGSVGNFRPEFPVLSVRGGSDGLNRFAVESDRVDVLSRPTDRGGGFNHVLAKAAREHDVHVEFDLGPVLRESGGKRVKVLSRLRKLREILDHYDSPYVVSANARSHLELRAPRELCAVGEAIGFSHEAIRKGLDAWETITDRNRHRLSDAFVEPGVRLGRYEGPVSDREEYGDREAGGDSE